MKMKGIVTGIVLTLVSIIGASAQAPSNTRVAVRESFKCEFHELDDYKHAHFNRAIHDRDNQRINIRKSDVAYQRNYKQQAGEPYGSTTITPMVREKVVSQDDEVVRQRDYKRMSLI
jgi:hypothetical protein